MNELLKSIVYYADISVTILILSLLILGFLLEVLPFSHKLNDLIIFIGAILLIGFGISISILLSIAIYLSITH